MTVGLAQFYQEHPLGLVYEDAEVTVFFGDRRSSREAVEAAYPDYRLMILRQTHSDFVVASPFEGEAPEADAHYTRVQRTALCIRTADCIPVMLYDPSSGMTGAVHAGWRGVENEVIRRCCAEMAKAGASLEQARVWIGPHIGAESFEVGRDVAEKLEARFDAVRGYSSLTTTLIAHPDPAKLRVNLLAIARAQLGSSGIENERVLEIPIDTMTSLQHESFRRDRDKAGRQISFIALKG